MKTADFDYALPKARIATRPASPRDAARLLVLEKNARRHLHVRDLPGLVRPGDLWVFNDVRVIPARILGRKPTGGRVEILLIEEQEPNLWLAWGRANKPLRAGQRILVAEDFAVEVVARKGKELFVRLVADDPRRALEAHGHVPLPPYIARADAPEDRRWYQTVFARREGAVAAPTAGLHFTEALLARLQEAGARLAWLTLHVGPGTFAPVETDEVEAHRMHAERYEIPAATAQAIAETKAKGGRIVAVGTTVVRALETSALRHGKVQAEEARTDLFIRPGFRFQVVDALMTNFHLPRSTLLMLVCAFAGRARVLAAYEEAVRLGYRFYSYGDAMFIPERMEEA